MNKDDIETRMDKLEADMVKMKRNYKKLIPLMGDEWEKFKEGLQKDIDEKVDERWAIWKKRMEEEMEDVD